MIQISLCGRSTSRDSLCVGSEACVSVCVHMCVVCQFTANWPCLKGFGCHYGNRWRQRLGQEIRHKRKDFVFLLFHILHSFYFSTTLLIHLGMLSFGRLHGSMGCWCLVQNMSRISLCRELNHKPRGLQRTALSNCAICLKLIYYVDHKKVIIFTINQCILSTGIRYP